MTVFVPGSYRLHCYRLHWWVFVPHQKLRKAAEVTLFGEQTVESRLFLAVCYWPEEHHRVVVYGCSSERCEDGAQGSRGYLTITAVPSLDRCLDCVRVAESYGEDDLAESWDSCVRFSCLRHGATVHTSFELVPPFPEFEPRLCLRRRGAVVINTGSFLHVVTAGLSAPATAESPPPPPVAAELADDASCAGSDQLSLASLEVDVSEEPLPTAPRGGLPWRFDPRSPRADEPRLRSPRAEEPRRQLAWRLPEPAERAASPAERRGRPWPRRLPAARQANMSADEYEFSEEGSDAHRENFSLFRRKRLADKKYEFSDENSENVPRFFAAVRPAAGSPAGPCLVPVSEALLSPAGGINSKRRLLEEEEKPAGRPSSDGDVLRAISCNTEPELFFTAESDCESEASILTASPRPPDRAARPPVVPASPPSPAACCVHVSRRFVEVDDELVSVATDIEEDDLSHSTGYHYALPLEVHGAGYAQMQAVSASRADKLALPSLLVSQLSLDMEQLCHKISQTLCAEAGKKYWFCNDYDVEIVEVSPDSGEVTVVAVVLVQAAIKTRGASKGSRRALGSVHRHQYRASFTFSWSCETGQCRLLTSEPLTEVTDRRDLQPAGGGPRWQPARLLAAALRHPRPLPEAPYSTVKVLTNEPALTGTSLTTIVDPLNMLALLLTPQRSSSEER
ncbi:DDB1- and CUL4-associated factor 15 [Amphibalanus amphitrite]|uniref:DDB1-and CUL4-associated factor 15 n=1 Tax=Amphibalanus amphitrite TaxID=1232801 RepID=A0A6A4X3Y5_AMPAM|nr:DDB1- and CUL4-associated factor 15 [Amphibalanus amphitrite]